MEKVFDREYAQTFEYLLREERLPRFAPVAYNAPGAAIGDVSAAVRHAIADRGVLTRVRPGMRVAITAGSREMGNMIEIFTQIVAQLASCGAYPFIVPAMGSHGGATAEGQRQLLEGYGLTEATLGCPILSSMETVRIGTSASGLPVYIDKNAAEADGIVVVNRVKPHTDFRGKVESGLMKMMTIGLGKQYGASVCHRQGFEHMAQNVWEFATEILRQTKVLFGVAIIEDCYHATSRVVAIPAERIPVEEPPLLELARSLMPSIPFDYIDSLYVQQIGKEISGSGMDPNVTGRSPFLPVGRPHAKSVAILDITEKSHGNGTGLGLADVTTLRAYEKYSFKVTLPTAITSCNTPGYKVPPVMPSDETAFKMAKRLAYTGYAPESYRAVWIRDTVSLRQFYISEALLEEAAANPDIRILDAPKLLQFDASGNLLPVYWRV